MKDSVEAYVADTFIKRLFGYMFRREPHHEAIIFDPCSSIHTFFMRFDIDVLFVDENMIIIKKVENLKPWKVIFPVKNCRYVIESKAGNFINMEEGSEICY